MKKYASSNELVQLCNQKDIESGSKWAEKDGKPGFLERSFLIGSELLLALSLYNIIL